MSRVRGWPDVTGPARAVSRWLPALVLLVAACGSGGGTSGGASGEAEEATTGTGGPESSEAGDGGESGEAGPDVLPPCDEVAPHLVVFGINGALTPDDEITQLLNDPGYDMQPSPGAADLVRTYHDQGYEILYATRGDGTLEVGDLTYTEALSAWFDRHGFPFGERARILTSAFTTELKNELLHAGTTGGEAYAAYTDVEELIEAFLVSGVPLERIYTTGDAAGARDTPAVGGDLAEHQATIGEPPPVCDPGD